MTKKSDQPRRGRGRPPKDGPARVKASFRFAPDLWAEFAAKVEAIQPRTTATAVLEMLMREWVDKLGRA